RVYRVHSRLIAGANADGALSHQTHPQYDSAPPRNHLRVIPDHVAGAGEFPLESENESGHLTAAHQGDGGAVRTQSTAAGALWEMAVGGAASEPGHLARVQRQRHQPDRIAR